MEDHRNQDIGGLDVPDRLGQDADRDVIGTDMAHIRRVAAQDQDDETGRPQGVFELVGDGLERIEPDGAGRCEVLDPDTVAHGDADEHEQDAHEKQG